MNVVELVHVRRCREKRVEQPRWSKRAARAVPPPALVLLLLKLYPFHHMPKIFWPTAIESGNGETAYRICCRTKKGPNYFKNLSKTRRVHMEITPFIWNFILRAGVWNNKPTQQRCSSSSVQFIGEFRVSFERCCKEYFKLFSSNSLLTFTQKVFTRQRK